MVSEITKTSAKANKILIYIDRFFYILNVFIKYNFIIKRKHV